MSLAIANDLVVSMHYTLTDDEGATIDSSEGQEPLAYLHGAGNIIPGLEKALEGKVVGDSLQVRVEAAEGYGEFVEDLVQKLPRELFEGVDNIEVGMSFEAQAPDGGVQHVVVKDVEDAEITIDANHPLAGIDLNFDVKVVDIRAATEEELEHGHAH